MATTLPQEQQPFNIRGPGVVVASDTAARRTSETKRLSPEEKDLPALFSSSLKVSPLSNQNGKNHSTKQQHTNAKHSAETAQEKAVRENQELFNNHLFMYTDGRQDTGSPNHLGHIAYIQENAQGHIFSPQAQDEANLVQNFAIQGAPSGFLPYTTSFGFPPLFYNTQLSEASRVFAPSPHMYPIMNSPFESQAFQQSAHSDGQQQHLMFGLDGSFQESDPSVSVQGKQAINGLSGGAAGLNSRGSPRGASTQANSSSSLSTASSTTLGSSSPRDGSQQSGIQWPGVENLAGMIGGMTPEETMMLTRQMLMGYPGSGLPGMDQGMLPRVVPMMAGVGLHGMPMGGAMGPMMGGAAGSGQQHSGMGGMSANRKPKSWADVLNTPAPNTAANSSGVGMGKGMHRPNMGHNRPYGSDKGMYNPHMHDKSFHYGGMEMHHHHHHPHHPHHRHHHHHQDKMAKGGAMHANQKHRGIDVIPTDAALSKKQELIQSLHLNPPDFDTNPSFARFFVIKSYSEDDIHKAIKYGIWASTDSGNRRLDAAHHDSSHKGPIYLFYSVNTSGQFCGMAQMMSSLDYGKKLDVWAQDKWNGSFAVKWLFVKDIPNSHLRHIRLTNNDNKPVTNSRDTQEVLLEPGKEMLEIFVNYNSKTSILDDFLYYDRRQEAMQRKERRPVYANMNLKAVSPNTVHMEVGKSQPQGIIPTAEPPIDNAGND